MVILASNDWATAMDMMEHRYLTSMRLGVYLILQQPPVYMAMKWI